MFGRQAMRLLRESWKGGFGTKRLSQELFAMFQDDIPLTHNGPITINQTGDGPALDIRRKPGSEGPLLQFGNRSTSYPGMPDIDIDDSGIDLDEDGGMILRGPYIDIVTDEDGEPVRRKLAGDGSPSPSIQITTSGGGGFPGQVVSGGPGASYTVAVYLDGLAQAATNLPVTQLSIDAAETIPAGAWVSVGSTEFEGTTSYFMQVPVWL